ncbi:MAG: NIL domain-containing protein [Candidatus Omnitrophota bacterium]|jgi:ABC-type methionine transport system ATPase subunit
MKIRAELTFPAGLKDKPIICDICKKFDIVMNIVEASFSTETGWSILVLGGAEQEIEKVLKYLKDTGVIIGETLNIA